MRHFRCTMVALGGLLLIVLSSTAARAASTYLETVLTSDIPGLGINNTSTNLLNPWGMGFSTTSPFWTGNQAAGTTTLYASPQGAENTTVGPVTIPGGGGTTSGSPGPTGVVSNGANANGDGVTGTGFTIIGQTPTPAAASFIFDNLNGTISAWNGGIGNHGTAIVQVTTPGASYTGLAIANNGTQDLLYAADNAAGSGHATIAVFQQTSATAAWSQVTLPGNFVDPMVAPGTAPYNVQFLNGQLYVTYQTGAVGIFTTNGSFVTGFVDSTDLKAPWGLALAPASFGSFGGDLLVANKTGGLINAYDPNNNFAFLGSLTDPNGNPISIPGIWAIAFRAASSGFNPNTLYFDAGVTPKGGNFYADGEFGSIATVPEPSSAILLGLGLIVLCGCCYWQVWRRRFQARPVLVAGIALR